MDVNPLPNSLVVNLGVAWLVGIFILSNLGCDWGKASCQWGPKKTEGFEVGICKPQNCDPAPHSVSGILGS